MTNSSQAKKIEIISKNLQVKEKYNLKEKI